MSVPLLPDSVLDTLADRVDEPAHRVVIEILADLGVADPEHADDAARSKKFPELVGIISAGNHRAVTDFFKTGQAIDLHIRPDLVRHAQAFFEENGISIITALFHAALPEAYLGKRGVQVLGMTGELVSNWTRRIQLTGQLLVTVLSPDQDLDDEHTSLHHDQVAAQAVRRVRLRHAAVRWVLDAAPDTSNYPSFFLLGTNPPKSLWDARMQAIHEDSVPSRPLNQADLLGTLGTFTTVTFDALEKLAVPFSDDDREAYYHLWNVVGWHLGIGDRASLTGIAAGAGSWPGNQLLPLTPAEMDEAFGRLRRKLQGTSEEGIRLAKALVQEMSRPLPGPLQGAPAFLVRYLIGDDLADALEIDAGGYTQLFVRKSGVLEHIAKRMRTNVVGEVFVSAVSSAITRYALRAYITESRGIDPGFTIDPGIANRWGVQTGPELSAPASP